MKMKGLIILRQDKELDSVELDVSLPVMFLEEAGGVVAYTPLLDYSTCGDNREDAVKMFDEGVRIFLKELVKMGTLAEVLHECGWQKVSQTKEPERWIPPEAICREQKVKVSIPVSV